MDWNLEGCLLMEANTRRDCVSECECECEWPPENTLTATSPYDFSYAKAINF